MILGSPVSQLKETMVGRKSLVTAVVTAEISLVAQETTTTH